MKKSPKGRSGNNERKSTEIRNGRGLKDLFAGAKARGGGGNPPPSRPRDFQSSSQSSNPSINQNNRPRYFMWSADGPMREAPSASSPAPKAREEQTKQTQVKHSQSHDHHSRDPRVEKREMNSTPHNRPHVREMVRTSERLRRPDKTNGRRDEVEDVVKEKFDFLEEDTAEVIEGGRRNRKKRRGREHKQQAKKHQPEAPVIFDEPKAIRQKQAKQQAGVQAAADGRFVEGIVKRHPDGFGFLIPDNSQIPDVYISRQHMTSVMTNDRVKVEVYSSRQADRLFGEVVQILKRAYSRVVGVYLPVDTKYGVIQGEGKGWGTDLRISAKDSMGANEGDLVAVEVIAYPDNDSEFTGRVIEIIGDIEEPLNDVKRVVFQAGIPYEFSAKALQEARKFPKTVQRADSKGRKDLRGKNLVTIDGATARDFDDAIYVEQQRDGFKLWVAIADVSHYVKPGTPLDEDAFARGTSTYFPNFVVPMLPEELSNELCSLKPSVARLCFCVEMEIDFQGHISSYEFYEGVMESKARVIYGEAQEILDGHTLPKLKHVAENIRTAGDLAKILMAKRFREGSLDLEIPETQVVVNEAGESVDIIKSERLFAHRLIEELMLAANICTARFMEEKAIPGIYRIHEEPFDENIQALQRFLYNFGGNRTMTGGKLQKKITRALQAFEGKPEAQILNILTLRTMQQAKYSGTNLGHFGLGFDQYSHFTSPIRRYPDLIAHRLIKSVLYPAYKKYRMTEEEIATATTMLSACEQRSVKAERQLINIKKSRFIGRFVGDEFEGVISGVTKFGVFVLLRAFDVDGLVKIEELGDDRFIFDQENLRLVGKRTGISYNIGDPVTVKVVSVDTEVGRAEFRLAGVTNGAPSKNAKKNRKDVQKRGKAADDRRRVRKERVSKRRRKA